MGQARFMRIVITGIVLLVFGGLAVQAFRDDRPQSLSASIVSVSVGVVIVAAVWLFARDKFEQARRQHRRKLKKGLMLITTTCRHWTDGTDIVLTYSDQSTIEINDEDEIPAWAKPSEVPLPK